MNDGATFRKIPFLSPLCGLMGHFFESDIIFVSDSMGCLCDLLQISSPLECSLREGAEICSFINEHTHPVLEISEEQA